MKQCGLLQPCFIYRYQFTDLISNLTQKKLYMLLINSRDLEISWTFWCGAVACGSSATHELAAGRARRMKELRSARPFARRISGKPPTVLCPSRAEQGLSSRRTGRLRVRARPSLAAALPPSPTTTASVPPSATSRQHGESEIAKSGKREAGWVCEIGRAHV